MPGCKPVSYTHLWGIYLGLGAAMLLGALTHHYFIIFAFFLSAFSVLYLLLRRRFADAGIFSGVMLAGVGLSIAIFPATLSHIFSGYRGEQSFSSFESGFSGLWEKLSAYCLSLIHIYLWHDRRPDGPYNACWAGDDDFSLWPPERTLRRAAAHERNACNDQWCGIYRARFAARYSPYLSLIHI